MGQKEDKESCSVNRRLAKLLCSARPSSARPALCWSFVRDAVCLKSSLATQNSASPSHIPLPPYFSFFRSLLTPSRQTFSSRIAIICLGRGGFASLREANPPVSRLLPSSKNGQSCSSCSYFSAAPALCRQRSHEHNPGFGSSLLSFAAFLTQIQGLQNSCASAYFGRRSCHSWNDALDPRLALERFQVAKRTEATRPFFSQRASRRRRAQISKLQEQQKTF